MGRKPEFARHPNLNLMDTQTRTKSIKIEVKKLISEGS